MAEADQPALFTEEPDKEYHPGKKTTWRDENVQPAPSPQAGQEVIESEPMTLQSEIAIDQGIKSSALARAEVKGGSSRRIAGELNMAVSRNLLNDTFTQNADQRVADERNRNDAETEMVRRTIAQASRRVVEPDKD